MLKRDDELICSPSHGENRGSSPLGSANKIKYLLQDRQLVSNNCPINVYGQAWTLMMTMPYARCAGDCQRICTGQRCANKYPTLARAEIPTQHIFGVFNGPDGSWIIHMRPQPEPSTQQVLAGLVERVTYHNAENGFCVLRARARGHRDVRRHPGHDREPVPARARYSWHRFQDR